MYHRLPIKQDTLLISGYQAAGTRGRKLVDKDPTIRIFGQDVPVNCRIETMTSLSGHADREELFAWLKNFTNSPKVTFTIHGENPGMSAYAQAIRDRMKWNVVEPNYLESYNLFKGI